MKTFLLIFLLIFNSGHFSPLNKVEDTVITGQQPNVAVDTKGVIRMVYGEGERIYCLNSKDNGISFSKPVLVGTVSGMQLGHSRGPQIASSLDFSLITAMDKSGNIQSFRLNHAKGNWVKFSNINDAKGTAPEGLMALTADRENNFYATWLDVRLDQKNNLYFSSINGKNSSWSKNQLIYQSPDEHVCECCKPNIYFHANKLVITFRNWLMGSRDIYYTYSVDKGRSFSKPSKSGMGTWKLEGCPMDGGGLSINDKGLISTVWQRQGEIFYWTEGRPEQRIASGRVVSMAQNGSSTLVAWQEKENIQLMDLKTKTTKQIGKGNSPKVYALAKGRSLCVWEEDKNVRYLTL